MKVTAIKKKVSERTLLKTASVMVILILLSTTLFSTGIESNADTLMPGTQAYYDQKFEEAKVAAGWKTAGVYTNNVTGTSITVTNPGPWMLDLNPSDYSGPWDGTTATNANNIPGDGTIANPYQVSTVAQFRYCVMNQKSFKLLKDIDLGGYLGRNWGTPTIKSTAAWVADGNGHTVYNYYSSVSSGYTSMFGTAKGLTIKNLRMNNSYVYGSGTSSAAALFVTNAENPIIENCAAENNVVFMQTSAWSAAVFDVDSSGTVIDNSYTNNCHIAVFSSGEASCCAQIIKGSSNPKVTNSFAINGTVIGNVGHNGGFTSCLTGGSTIENCFSDVEIYGKLCAGNFIGIQHRTSGSNTHTVKNCFTSGKVEGVNGLGGFIGTPEQGNGTLNTIISQCYSTSMVGMMSDAQRQGSFMGTYSSPRVSGQTGPISYQFTDCFGAGEVGSLGVNVNAGRGSNSNTTGGFMGEHSSSIQYGNCYYDKQTTAMKEWALGVNNSTGGYTSAGCQTLGSNFGIKGVLTTDAEKNGTKLTGLTSLPSSNGAGSNAEGSQSFTGFTDNNQWVFEEGSYPQLKVFTNPTTFKNNNWMTTTELHNLVKAYSKASVSTAKLETWDKNYEGSVLPATTYDTVRDLTLQFSLSSDTNTSWEKDHATADIWGDTVDVLKLTRSTGDEWYCSDFVPGIEWLTVKHQVDGQEGMRRLRIIPTAALDAGVGKTLTRGNTYDHADDVRLAYSTGARLNTNSADITVGVFPDSPLNAYQSAAQPALTGTALTNFNAANDFYRNVYAGHLTKSGTTDNTANSNMNVYIYKDAVIDPVSGEVTIGDSVAVDNNKNSGANALNNQKFNGYEPFPETADTRYFIDYVWNLQDGRYLQNGKALYVKGSPYNVEVMAENTDGSANSTGLYLSASDTAGPNFGSSPRASDQIDRIAGAQAKTSWRAVNKKVIVTKLTLQTTYDDEGNWGTPVSIDDPKENDTITIPRLYQRRVTLDNGSYYTENIEINKTYTVKKGTVGGNDYYYLEFTKADNVSGIDLNDVEDDIKVVLTIDYLRTDLQIKKYLESTAEEDEEFVFQLDYRGVGDQAGPVEKIMYAIVKVPAGQSSKEVTFKGMDIGWYTVTELNSNWRFGLVSSKLAEGNPDAETIDAGKGAVTLQAEVDKVGSFTYYNERLDEPWANGKFEVTNEMPSADDILVPGN